MQCEECSVINVRVSDIRPQYDNLYEWRKEPNNVYIGRKGVVFINGIRYPAENSIWANPYKLKDEADREDVLESYECYIREKLENDPRLLNKLLALDGKTLGCWCAPKQCHGDVLVRLVKEYKSKI